MASGASGALIVQRMADIHIVEFVETNIIDQLLIERIKEELLDLAERAGHPKLIINFSGVKHISSAMLGTLMALQKKVKAAEGEIRLLGINDQLLGVFKLTRLDKVLKIYKNLDAALHKF